MNGVGGGGPIDYTFATNDNKNYTVLNYNPGNGIDKNLNTLDKIDADNTTFEKSKISGVDYIDGELPKNIKLDSNFSLYSKGIYSDNLKNQVIESTKLKQLILKDFPYQIFTQKYEPISDTNISDSTDKLIDGFSTVAIPDSSGLVYKYSLVWDSKLVTMPKAQEKFNQEKDVYNSFYDKKNARSAQLGLDKNFDSKLNDKLDKEFPNPPTYPIEPTYDLSFLSNQAIFNTNEKSYKSYSTAFPGTCGLIGDLNTVSGIADNDLIPIGKFDNVSIFKLKDTNHPLYRDQYKAKVTSQITSLDTNGKEFQDSNAFSSLNNGTKMPTFEEYVKQNPLLLFRDPFNRLMIAGEWDYQLAGGCGKPVVYLYPTIPTKVNVKFLANIQLTTDIPKYVQNLGWHVLAKPTGELQDLQTQYTNCDIFNNPHAGSEYAKNACVQNNYPYLYWSGNRIGAEYPKQSNGWIVEKKDLNSFLNAKLDEVGFNQKEKSDMLEYWIPYLNNKSGDYFRLSFLQTKEMNALAPMQITPRPDKVFRILLDWDSYKTKPDFEIQPQVLDKLNSRDGFTVVEWGGLKK
jgi:hypothetical protein